MAIMVLSGLRGGPDEMGKCWDDESGAPAACPGVGSGSGTGAGTQSGGVSSTNLNSIFTAAGAFVQGLFGRQPAPVVQPIAQPEGFPWGLVIGGVAVVGVGYAAMKWLKK